MAPKIGLVWLFRLVRKRDRILSDSRVVSEMSFSTASEERDKDKPFFLYLAYTAPHWPHQAHEEDIAKYRGKYLQGWDQLRKSRYERQLELKLFDKEHQLTSRDKKVPAWDTLTPEKQDEMDLRMAVYAAMIDRMDQNIGKLIQRLQEWKLFDNTLILFMSDNGACAEGADPRSRRDL